jgi:hypothetical protein
MVFSDFLAVERFSRLYLDLDTRNGFLFSCSVSRAVALTSWVISRFARDQGTWFPFGSTLAWGWSSRSVFHLSRSRAPLIVDACSDFMSDLVLGAPSTGLLLGSIQGAHFINLFLPQFALRLCSSTRTRVWSLNQRLRLPSQIHCLRFLLLLVVPHWIKDSSFPISCRVFGVVFQSHISDIWWNVCEILSYFISQFYLPKSHMWPCLRWVSSSAVIQNY